MINRYTPPGFDGFAPAEGDNARERRVKGGVRQCVLELVKECEKEDWEKFRQKWGWDLEKESPICEESVRGDRRSARWVWSSTDR